MEIRQITPNYAVSPQIAASDVEAIAKAGFCTIICNRPDQEIPQSYQADVIRSATISAGMTFVEIPVTHQGLNDDIVRAQKAAIEGADGPVLAYCASGTRSSIVWSLAMASELSPDAIMSATSAAGYSLDGLRPRLDAIAAGKLT